MSKNLNIFDFFWKRKLAILILQNTILATEIAYCQCLHHHSLRNEWNDQVATKKQKKGRSSILVSYELLKFGKTM